jgi:hypothetical protein
MYDFDPNRLTYDALLQLAKYCEQQALYFRDAAAKIIEKPKIERKQKQEQLEINAKLLEIHNAIEGFRAAGMTAKESFIQARATYPNRTLVH